MIDADEMTEDQLIGIIDAAGVSDRNRMDILAFEAVLDELTRVINEEDEEEEQAGDEKGEDDEEEQVEEGEEEEMKDHKIEVEVGKETTRTKNKKRNIGTV